MNLLPKTEANQRLRILQVWMETASVDAVFILQNADLYYFAGTIQAGLLCLPVSGSPVYLVQKSLARAKAESAWEKLLPMPHIGKAADLLAGEGLKGFRRIGLEMDVLPAGHYLRFQSLFPGVEFVDASTAIRETRMIKSDYEVSEIRTAARVLQEGFEEIPGWLRPGMTELELSARLEGFLRRHGHQGLTRMRSFGCEIGYGFLSAGPNACYPTCFPGPVGFLGLYPAISNGGSERPMVPGDTLMADIVGGYGGYIADKTRTFVLGDAGRPMEEAHAFVLDLVRELESLLRPGIPCARIFDHALSRVRESPYADKFMGAGDSRVRFVGHGVGLELDELPVLSSSSRYVLQKGMTIAIEPKLFFPDKGGVGIEDTYVITDGGCEKLTPSPVELLRLG